MLRALLVDDEPAARRGLRRHLRAESDIEIVGECGDGVEAIQALGELRPDLLFLDIQMPGVGGFEVIDAIGLERMPATIFVTAYDQFALRAFEVHAVDYVLKPIDGERLRSALARVRQFLRPDGDFVARVAAALGELGVAPPPRWSKRIALQGDGRITLVEARDVDRIEAAGNYVQVFAGGQARLLRETLTGLEERLDPERFVRVSRSALVNIDRVREIRPMFHGDFVVVLRDGAEIAGSRRYREALERLIT